MGGTTYARLRRMHFLIMMTMVLGQQQASTELFHVDRGDVRYSALPGGGLEVFDLSTPTAPRSLGRFAEGRVVSNIIVQGDTLVLLETHEEATRWSLNNPRQPSRVSGPAPLAQAPEVVPSSPPAGATVLAARATIEQVRDGRIVLSAGAAQGFVKGAHVRVLAQRLEKKPDLSSGNMAELPSNAVTAVVRIEESQGEKAMARLGRGDIAEVGDLAELTDAPLSERLLFPRRSPFKVLAGFHLRPFLGLESGTASGTTRSFGMLTDLYASYYFESVPMAVNVSVAPVGFTIGAIEGHYPVTFAATATYATDWFEIGLGAGGLVGNPGPCVLLRCEVNTGFTVNQVLRLGALDGFNLTWRSSIFSRPDRFVFGVGRGEIAVPFTSQLGLFGAGGGGENGWAFGELGLRTYVGGIGAKGTVIVSASLGYAAIFDGPSHENVGGPSVAFGMEWRL